MTSTRPEYKEPFSTRHQANVFVGVDVTKIRLIEDRVLIQDLDENEVRKIGSIWVPEIDEKSQGAGKGGLLRWGRVIATGPGDKFIECGLDQDAVMRKRLITQKCGVCEGTGYTDWPEKHFNAERKTCLACYGKGRISVRVPPQCSVGDKVLYDRRKHEEIYVDGVRYSLVHAEQAVFAVVEEDEA